MALDTRTAPSSVFTTRLPHSIHWIKKSSVWFIGRGSPRQRSHRSSVDRRAQSVVATHAHALRSDPNSAISAARTGEIARSDKPRIDDSPRSAEPRAVAEPSGSEHPVRSDLDRIARIKHVSALPLTDP